MSKTVRLQVPVAPIERTRYQLAARRAGLPLAAWVRANLDSALAGGKQDPAATVATALETLFGLEAPVADVATMKRESLAGRYPPETPSAD